MADSDEGSLAKNNQMFLYLRESVLGYLACQPCYYTEIPLLNPAEKNILLIKDLVEKSENSSTALYQICITIDNMYQFEFRRN